MKVLVAGDFYDGYRVSDYCQNNRDYSPFLSLSDIIKEADYKILNFEFPIGSTKSTPIEKAGPNLKGNLCAIKTIKDAGFNVCTLANNHILDQGEYSCIDTKEHLETNGFYTVGAGKNILDASSILYLKKGDETLAIINCCEHEFSIATDNGAGANPINPIQQYYKILEAKSNADYVIVIVHGGLEHYQLPSPRMKETYRFFVDLGADAVVNHHQHCYSGYEVYKGKPIFYGLGNLLFDNPDKRKSQWNEGYITVLVFSKGKEPLFKLHPYKQCDEKPTLELMLGTQKIEFDNSINKLNTIISNDDLLKKNHDEWTEKNSQNYLIIFQPYIHSLFRSLYVRRLLPTFMDKRKKYHILGMLSCESHLERLIYMVKKIKVR